MHAADGAALGVGQHVFAIEGDAEVVQAHDDGVGAAGALGLKVVENGQQGRVGGVNAETQDVYLASSEGGADFRASQELETAFLGGALALPHSGDGVVVGDGDGGEAQGGGARDDFGGGVDAVRAAGVEMEIDEARRRGSVPLQLVQHAVDEAGGLVGAELFCHLDGLVDGHLRRDVGKGA